MGRIGQICLREGPSLPEFSKKWEEEDTGKEIPFCVSFLSPASSAFCSQPSVQYFYMHEYPHWGLSIWKWESKAWPLSSAISILQKQNNSNSKLMGIYKYFSFQIWDDVLDAGEGEIRWPWLLIKLIGACGLDLWPNGFAFLAVRSALTSSQWHSWSTAGILRGAGVRSGYLPRQSTLEGSILWSGWFPRSPT